jgi:hypothetical protein
MAVRAMSCCSIDVDAAIDGGDEFGAGDSYGRSGKHALERSVLACALSNDSISR